jgi:CRP-like cAMP-binding protein
MGEPVEANAMKPHDVLKSIPIFASILNEAQLAALANRLGVTNFARGTVLMRQGEMGASMFAIVSGVAEVSVHVAGGKESVAKLGPGDIVGEISLMTGAYRNATVTATRALSALEITKPALQSVLSESPDLIPRFAGMIEQRQAEMNKIRKSAAHWDSVGLDRHGIENMMRSFYIS